MKARIEHAMHVLRWLPYSVIFLALFQVALWAADRRPPFTVLEGTIVPPTVAGGVLRIEGKVIRDLTRNCNLFVTQWVEDRVGFRHYLASVEMQAESIRKLEEISPGLTRYAPALPPGIPAGSAVYHAESQYACNPVHALWPITIITRIPFTVEAKP
jgi:hypothetical protein